MAGTKREELLAEKEELRPAAVADAFQDAFWIRADYIKISSFSDPSHDEIGVLSTFMSVLRMPLLEVADDKGRSSANIIVRALDTNLALNGSMRSESG